MTTDSNWEKYQKLVLDKLESNERSINYMTEKLNKIEIDLAGLKIKTGIWGALSGTAAVIAGFLIKAFIRIK